MDIVFRAATLGREIRCDRRVFGMGILFFFFFFTVSDTERSRFDLKSRTRIFMSFNYSINHGSTSLGLQLSSTAHRHGERRRDVLQY